MSQDQTLQSDRELDVAASNLNCSGNDPGLFTSIKAGLEKSRLKKNIALLESAAQINSKSMPITIYLSSLLNIGVTAGGG